MPFPGTKSFSWRAGLFVLMLHLLLLLAGPSLFSQHIEGRVTGIADGDTVDVTSGGRTYTVRLNGIDCPEKNQPYGDRAREFTAALVFNQQVRVEVNDIDRYGRFVGEVFVDGKSLNRELVAAGLAWWYRYYARQDEELARLEAEARRAALGLWKRKGAVPPWEWRRGRRTPEEADVPPPYSASPSGHFQDSAQASEQEYKEASKRDAHSRKNWYDPETGLRYDPQGPDRDCSDFAARWEAQLFFEAAGGPDRDPHRLDSDGDGRACEGLQ